MTNYITQKAFWQAKISQCTPSAQKMLSIILSDSIKHKFVTIPRSRFSRRIGKSIKTVDRGSKQLQDLELIKVKSGQLTHEYNIYIPNPILFDLANDFKDKLFSLKQYIYESTNSFLVENVSPYIDNIRSQFNSSSFSIFFKKKLPIVPLEVRSLEYNSLDLDRKTKKRDSWIEKCVESFWFYTPSLETMAVEKLSPEEFTKILEESERSNNEQQPTTNNNNDTDVTEMYRHLQFDCLGSKEGININ